MSLLESLGAGVDPAPAAGRAVEADAAPGEPVYTDAQIAAAVDVGWNDDLDRIMHSCTANIGGFWNRLSETLSTAEGQPLRAFRIHGQPPLSTTMDGTTTANLFGASIELFGAVATFNSDDIRRIVENADLETLVITQTGEFKCNLDDTRLERGFNPAEYR